MTETTAFDAAPGHALAEGFALQVERWALAQGADVLGARWLREAARALSLAIGDGHVCLPLADLAAELTESPGLPALRRALSGSGVVGTPQTPAARPLILDDDDRLYLHRHFDYERRLARRLVRAAGAAPTLPDAATAQRLRTLFQSQGSGDDGPDWQKLAAALALRQRLVVISGGPGTGKTTTVVNLLACLLEQQPEARIALAAPTGKAAARMSEALRQRAAHLPPALRERLPAEASTVHRLLGAYPGGFMHDAARPLPVDALVVDEASMLDLALATRLLEAVPETARLVLLGDKDQLAAVESGAVFAELSADPTLSEACIAELARLGELPPQAIVPAPALQLSPLRDSVVWLTRNFRFSADSAIARAAALVREGRAEALLQQLRSDGDAGEDRSLHWLADTAAALDARTLQAMRDGFAPYFQALRDGADLAALTQAFGRFRVLCALRAGPRGAQAVNRRLADEASALLASATRSDVHSAFFPGRPVMVLRNDPLLRLFNGDIGITLPGADGAPWVHFADAAGGYRALPASRLPAHETAFAMTVHKAQGSEFDAVLVLLPAQRSRVLSRELLYTALTRARQHVWLAAEPGVLAATVTTRTRRQSGLLARLREAAGTA